MEIGEILAIPIVYCRASLKISPILQSRSLNVPLPFTYSLTGSILFHCSTCIEVDLELDDPPY